MRRGMVVGLGIATLAAGALVGSPRVQGAAQEKERVKRIEVIRPGGGARLGVELEEVDKDDVARLKLGQERGAVVRRVEEGSPAAKAGLQKDDVILRFEGEDVRSARQLARIVRETPAGRTVGIDVSRGGAAQRLTATLAEGSARAHFGDFDVPMPVLPEPPEAPEPPSAPDVRHWKDRGEPGFAFRELFGDRQPARLGIEFDEVSGQYARFLHAPGEQALVVTSVKEGSPAEKAGLRAGDLILRFAGREIREARDLREEVRKAEGGKELALSVQREGKPLDLKVTLQPREGRRRSSDETT